jgi:SAM-dependent methyltransferase
LTDIDRQKWNQRYLAGAYAERTSPSEILAGWLDRLPAGRALDVACGAGRNALFLAQHGYGVDAVDIAGVALARAAARAAASHLAVNWLERDLDQGLGLPGPYQLIVMIRYVNRPVLRQALDLLAPGGCLVCEQHLLSDAGVVGPTGERFRVQPGELAAACSDMTILHAWEGLEADPDGRIVAVARVVARRA